MHILNGHDSSQDNISNGSNDQEGNQGLRDRDQEVLHSLELPGAAGEHVRDGEAHEKVESELIAKDEVLGL